MKFGILPWLERGHAFTQNIKNHLFCIKIKWAFSSIDENFTLLGTIFFFIWTALCRPCWTGCWAVRLNWLLGSLDVSDWAIAAEWEKEKRRITVFTKLGGCLIAGHLGAVDLYVRLDWDLRIRLFFLLPWANPLLTFYNELKSEKITDEPGFRLAFRSQIEIDFRSP